MSDPYQPPSGGEQPSTPPQPPQYPQQQGYPQAGYPQQPYPQYAPEVPGRTMGIVGFVLAFVMAPAGIVVSAIALKESKKAGVPNTLGTWGLWLSIGFTALSVLFVVIWFVFVLGVLAVTTTAVSTLPPLPAT